MKIHSVIQMTGQKYFKSSNVPHKSQYSLGTNENYVEEKVQKASAKFKNRYRKMRIKKKKRFIQKNEN